ncbi:hypothetical protein QTJ16_001662 [Diplocarpon rosae]|uniref:Uncharacterized protein n=1 Tax=Diplocarpon rosae TaxID=946125 RepID=A0AAD9T4E9_9HELO|nr:hypothetical protein QTJ16_001662 [Diplocarpon rosae]
MFYVHHCPTYIRDNLITAKTTQSSWEDVKVLASADARTHVCGFYKHHPAEFGKEMVLAIWKEYVVIDDDQELGAKWAQSAKASDEKTLAKIIKKQKAVDEAAAAKRKKSAKKAAAAAAAASPAAQATRTKGAGGVVKESAKKT